MYLFLHKDMIHLVKEVSRGDEGDDGGALKETRAGEKMAKNKGQRGGKAGGINKRESQENYHYYSRSNENQKKWREEGEKKGETRHLA